MLCWELKPLEKILSTSRFIELLSALKSIQRMNNLFADLPQTPSVKNLSKNIKKKKPILKNVLLSTCELKNALGCSCEHSMCHHPSCCRPLPNDVLGEESEKTFKILLWKCRALLNVQLISKALDK